MGEKDWLHIASPTGSARVEKIKASLDSRDWLDLGSAAVANIGAAGTLMAFLYFDKPMTTEKEARAAVAHILQSGHASEFDLNLVASLFVPEREGLVRSVWKVVFKKIGTGHASPFRDIGIAAEVHAARARGTTYEKAITAAAEKFGFKDERQVSKIYGKVYKTGRLPALKR